MPSNPGPLDAASQMVLPSGHPINVPAGPSMESYVSMWSRLEGLDHLDQVGQRSSAHLPRQLATMDFDSDLGETHLGRDLLVHQPGRNMLQYFALALRQSGEPGAQANLRLLLLAPGAVALEREPHRVENVFVAERLGQKLDG